MTPRKPLEQLTAPMFSIALDATGRIIRSTADVAPGEEIRTKLKEGVIRSTVK